MSEMGVEGGGYSYVEICRIYIKKKIKYFC